MCYKIVREKKDLWIAMIGCIADQYMPEFTKEFIKEYPDLLEESKEPKKDVEEICEITTTNAQKLFGLNI